MALKLKSRTGKGNGRLTFDHGQTFWDKKKLGEIERILEQKPDITTRELGAEIAKKYGRDLTLSGVNSVVRKVKNTKRVQEGGI